jgi:hypothetical protein
MKCPQCQIEHTGETQVECEGVSPFVVVDQVCFSCRMRNADFRNFPPTGRDGPLKAGELERYQLMLSWASYNESVNLQTEAALEAAQEEGEKRRR